MKNILLLFLSVIAFSACSSDPDSTISTPLPQPLEPRVSTEVPSFYPAGTKFNGIIIYEGRDGYFKKGFCWSGSANPTILDNVAFASGTGEGPFYANQEYSLNLAAHTTYNVRAFVQRTSTTTPIYGSNIVFTTP